MSSRHDITRLLELFKSGDRGALDALFPIVYAELRSIARRQRAGHRAATLSTTAIVHEAYLKLLAGQQVAVENRRHFFSLAARAMRQILIDGARRRLAKKRGEGKPESPDDDGVDVGDRAEELIDLHRALDRLQGTDERLGQIVELRFFGGLSVEETADLLTLSPRTIKRDWRKARAFLYREMSGDAA